MRDLKIEHNLCEELYINFQKLWEVLKIDRSPDSAK